MKHIRCILAWVLIILLLFFAYIGFSLMDTCVIGEDITIWVPEEGIWYCDELQIGLSFTKDKESYMIINGQEVLCVCENDKGSKDMLVLVQEEKHGYSLGELAFWGRYVALDEGKYTVQDCNSGEEYIFVIIN